MFLEQLLEPYTNRIMKWSHFLTQNNLSKGFEPIWYKKLCDIVIEIEEDMLLKEIFIVLRKWNNNEIILRKNIGLRSRKDTNKEIIMWKKNDENIFSIKQKKSNSKHHDEVGKHLVINEHVDNSTNLFDSPFLMDCSGCKYDISRKRKEGRCLIYIEKDIATMVKGRKILGKEANVIVKPYMTLENIISQNELVVNGNLDNFKAIDQYKMKVDSEVNDNINLCLKWLVFLIEESDAYIKLKLFISNNLSGFLDKTIIVNLGGVIQKGDDLCLDGFFGIEIIPKDSDTEKFSFEGAIKFTKNIRKAYILGLIVALVIIPCNVKIELRTDLNIVKWLYTYSLMGSIRKELDDKLYI